MEYKNQIISFYCERHGKIYDDRKIHYHPAHGYYCGLCRKEIDYSRRKLRDSREYLSDVSPYNSSEYL